MHYYLYGIQLYTHYCQIRYRIQHVNRKKYIQVLYRENLDVLPEPVQDENSHFSHNSTCSKLIARNMIYLKFTYKNTCIEKTYWYNLPEPNTGAY